MELQTFIAETLKQIVAGITTAQEDLKGQQTVIINPRSISQYGGVLNTDSERHSTVQIIEFEVLLGQTEGLESKGGIGVFLASVGVGAQGKTETGSSAVNKIKFSIPVVFPHR